MPLALPNLDDKSYQALVDEAIGAIPAIAPEWTNFNSSDPGITLIELFAWFTETLLYRVNRVTAANTEAFLKLLNGPDWTPAPGEPIEDQIRETVIRLRTPQRAVTTSDYETLAAMADPGVAQARAFARRNLALGDPATRAANAAGYMSVVVVPQSDLSVRQPAPSPALLGTVSDFLDPRRLITTAVQVVAPRYIASDIAATLVIENDADAATVKSAALAALTALTHPLLGGFDGKGWPSGRSLYASDLYTLLASIPGVDYVQDPIAVNTVALAPWDFASTGVIALTMAAGDGRIL